MKIAVLEPCRYSGTDPWINNESNKENRVNIVAEFSGIDAGIIIMTPHKGSMERIAYVFYSIEDGIRLVRTHAGKDPNAQSVIADIQINPFLPLQHEQSVLTISATFSTSKLTQLVALVAGLSQGALTAATYNGRIGTIIAAETSMNPDFPDAFVCGVDPNGVHTFGIYFSRQQVADSMHSLEWLKYETKTSIIEFMESGTLPKRSDKPPILITGNLAGYLNSVYVLHRQMSRQMSVNIN